MATKRQERCGRLRKNDGLPSSPTPVGYIRGSSNNKFMFFGLFKKKNDEEYKGIAAQWQEIEKLMQGDSALSWKMAVIEADKLMDSALKQAFMRGANMGERLRFATHKHPKIQKVWEAHILRNDLVHQSDRRLSRGEAEKAINQFRDGLKTLKML